jgi:glycosyltransferase involved in cell wall biosynthesis
LSRQTKTKEASIFFDMKQTKLVTVAGNIGSWGHKQVDESTEMSVVIPISERRDDLRQLFLGYLQEILKTGLSYEVIFVLDGPDPDALFTLKSLKVAYPDIRIVALNRRFGEATALSVGFETAKGSLILTLPAYFQVEPYEIPKMLQTLSTEKSDLVIGWRWPRVDSLFNRLQSKVFHRLVRVLTGTNYHDVSCGMRLMKRKVTEEISLYGDLHRFFPISAYQLGFRVSEAPVSQSPRDRRRRVNKPGVYLRRLIDIVTFFFLYKFTKKPLRFFGLLGSGIFALGVVLTSYIGVERLLGISPAGRPLLILGVLFMVFGVQLFSTGLLGEIIIFTHARSVRDYQTSEILD